MEENNKPNETPDPSEFDGFDKAESLIQGMDSNAVASKLPQVEFHDDKLWVKGECYDPEIHQLGSDGLPEINSRGALKRKRGRKNEKIEDYERVKKSVGSGQGETKKSGSKKSNIDESTKAAESTTASLEVIHIMLLGEHCKMTPEQKSSINETLRGVYEKHGVMQVPVELQLCVSLGMYEYAVFSNPVTKEKLKNSRTPAGLTKLKNLFNRKKMNKQEPVSQEQGEN